MTRAVKFEAKAPMEVKISDESKWICMCGLSQSKPFCDGTHKKCNGEEDGKVYYYDKHGNRVEVKL